MHCRKGQQTCEDQDKYRQQVLFFGFHMVPSRFHSMIKFLLICPTSALEKIFNPQNILYINLRLKIVSALNLNKFPKNLIVEFQEFFELIILLYIIQSSY